MSKETPVFNTDFRVREPDRDVIVVGAGPGGSIAAAELALSGYDVLLLDMQSFPRDKACGDGVPAHSFRWLDRFGISSEVSKLDLLWIHGVSIQGPGGRVRATPPDNTGAAFTSRRLDFDATLFGIACASGARFEQLAVERLLYDRNGRVIGVKGKGGREILSQVVIAADGATSRLARELLAVKSPPYTRAIAARQYAVLKKEMPSFIFLRYLSQLTPGYAWIFPLSNSQANVGIGLFDERRYRGKANLRELLDEFVASIQSEFPMELIDGTYRAWSIPCWTPSMPWNRRGKRLVNGVCLVGDAGGNVDFLTGGGIHPAIKSGSLAALRARHLLEGMEQRAADALFWREYKRSVRPLLLKTYLAQELIGKHPRVMDLLLNTIPEGAEHSFLSSLAGDHVGAS